MSSESSDASAGHRGTRFIILGAARTGSTMLVSALNSHPDITCFGELFNGQAAHIDFSVTGYDRYNKADRELRRLDFCAFLQERIFVRPRGIAPIGFKILYPHFFDFPGLREWLVEQSDIRILHLRRRNLLRMLISTELAKATGRWVEPESTGRSHLPRLRDLLPGSRQRNEVEAITLPLQECKEFFMRTELQVERHDELFSAHQKLTLYYEDLLDDLRGTLDPVQRFLGVTPRTLEVSTRRQHPEPLRSLIANYDELQEGLKGTPCEQFFD